MLSCFNWPIHLSNIGLVCHADWSIHAQKRWAAVARLKSNYHWQVQPLVLVVEPMEFLLELKSQASSAACILVGFDFPIGLPLGYAHKAGITNFLSILPLLGSAGWEYFFYPAETPEQIRLQRPFYPRRPGNARRLHLENGLGLQFGQLYRLCEKTHENRRAACPLFWTLGSQQVGKAAIHGWRNLLSPALVHPDLRLKLWPFSGTLAELCQPESVIAVETYPAEYYAHLGILQPVGKLSKRRQKDRRSCTTQLIYWSHLLNMDLGESMLATIENGFGEHPSSEDQFDALVGLYGMINVLVGNRPTGEPFSPPISMLEGWIFGQEQPGSDR